MLADCYDKEQAELTEKIEQYEREAVLSTISWTRFRILLIKSASTLASPN